MSDLVGASSLVSSALKQEELFPIREVARLTGVNPVTAPDASYSTMESALP